MTKTKSRVTAIMTVYVAKNPVRSEVASTNSTQGSMKPNGLATNRGNPYASTDRLTIDGFDSLPTLANRNSNATICLAAVARNWRTNTSMLADLQIRGGQFSDSQSARTNSTAVIVLQAHNWFIGIFSAPPADHNKPASVR